MKKPKVEYSFIILLLILFTSIVFNILQAQSINELIKHTSELQKDMDLIESHARELYGHEHEAQP